MLASNGLEASHPPGLIDFMFTGLGTGLLEEICSLEPCCLPGPVQWTPFGQQELHWARAELGDGCSCPMGNGVPHGSSPPMAPALKCFYTRHKSEMCSHPTQPQNSADAGKAFLVKCFQAVVVSSGQQPPLWKSLETSVVSHLRDPSLGGTSLHCPRVSLCDFSFKSPGRCR